MQNEREPIAIGVVTAGISKVKDDHGRVTPDKIGMKRLARLAAELRRNPLLIVFMWGGYVGPKGMVIVDVYLDFFRRVYKDLAYIEVITVGDFEVSVDNIPVAAARLKKVLDRGARFIAIVTEPEHFAWLRYPWEALGFHVQNWDSGAELSELMKKAHGFLTWVTKGDYFWKGPLWGRLCGAYVSGDAKKFKNTCKKLLRVIVIVTARAFGSMAGSAI